MPRKQKIEEERKQHGPPSARTLLLSHLYVGSTSTGSKNEKVMEVFKKKTCHTHDTKWFQKDNILHDMHSSAKSLTLAIIVIMTVILLLVQIWAIFWEYCDTIGKLKMSQRTITVYQFFLSTLPWSRGLQPPTLDSPVPLFHRNGEILFYPIFLNHELSHLLLFSFLLMDHIDPNIITIDNNKSGLKLNI